MKGDFTRDTFDPRNNYTSVLMQQGRVQVDADWNEQAAIARHQLRTFIADIVGPHGGPRADGDGGFKIAVTADGELVVGPGRYYVGGLMCENDAAVNYTTQPGYPFDGEPTPDQLHAPGEFLLYLDVWERHVSSFERPDREVALDGPDTATRAQLVWQVWYCCPRTAERHTITRLPPTFLRTAAARCGPAQRVTSALRTSCTESRYIAVERHAVMRRPAEPPSSGRGRTGPSHSPSWAEPTLP